MSKDVKVEKPSNNDVVKEPNDEVKEAIESLKIQLQEHSKQVEHHNTIAIKAQGALEVLLQLYPQEEDNNK